jgi:hypothetical protein
MAATARPISTAVSRSSHAHLTAKALVFASLFAVGTLFACGGEETDAPDADAAADADATTDTPPSDAIPDTAGDTVGPDTVQPDGLADATPDAGPKPKPLAIGAGVAAAFCEDLCGADSGECSLAPVGGDPVACVTTCKQRAASDGWWLANYLCFSETCDAKLCQLDGVPLPLPAPEQCDALCEAFGDCELLELIDIPSGEVNLCRAACAGQIAAGDREVAGFPCALAALENKCSTEQLGKCFGAESVLDPDTCVQACASFYLDSASNPRFCQPDSELRSAWPAPKDCEAACMNTGTPERASRFSGCLLQNGCDNPAPCTNPPNIDDQACVDGCNAFGTLCAGKSWALTATTCPLLCTGVLLAEGQSGDSGVATCVERLKTCPENPAEQTQALFTCALPKSAECQSLCDALVPCAADAGLTQAICLADCTFGTYGAGLDLSSKAGCVQKSPICTDVLKCLAPTKPDPLCEANCAHRTACSDGPIPDCVDICTDTLKKGGKSLATAVCEILSPCNDLEVCASLPSFEVPATCVAACDGAPDTCAVYADDCTVACMGALTGASLTVSAASCAVGKLGVDCDVTAVSGCK